jgi:hypothetical protein
MKGKLHLRQGRYILCDLHFPRSIKIRNSIKLKRSYFSFNFIISRVCHTFITAISNTYRDPPWEGSSLRSFPQKIPQ